MKAQICHTPPMRRTQLIEKHGYANLDPYGISIPIVLLPAFVLWPVVSVIYSAIVRTLDDVITYAAIPSAVFCIIIALLGTSLIVSGPRKSDVWTGVFLVVMSPIAATSCAVFYYLLLAAQWDLAMWFIDRWTLEISSILATATVTLLIGSGLFYFRLKARCIYGLTEAMVGLSIAGYKFVEIGSAQALRDPNFFVVILTAGVYLVVRGFDNIHQGLTKEPVDKLAMKVLIWWKSLGRPIDYPQIRKMNPTRKRLQALRDKKRSKYHHDKRLLDLEIL